LRVLFFGELFPYVVHGMSIANQLNLDLLSKVIEVDIIQEKTKVDSVGKASYGKAKELLTAISKIWKQSRAVPYQSFYIVISLSLFGMLKILLAVYAFLLVFIYSCFVEIFVRGVGYFSPSLFLFFFQEKKIECMSY